MTDKVDNVVVFPRAKKNAPPQRIEEIQQSISEIRLDHIENVLSELLPPILYGINEVSGHDFMDDKYTKDMAFIVQSIKSLLMKGYNMDDPFHNFIENFYSITHIGDIPVAIPDYSLLPFYEKPENKPDLVEEKEEPKDS